MEGDYVRWANVCDGWMRVKDKYVWNAWEKWVGMTTECVWKLSVVEAVHVRMINMQEIRMKN